MFASTFIIYQQKIYPCGVGNTLDFDKKLESKHRFQKVNIKS